MGKGRTTTVISIRDTDDILLLLKAKAAKKGISYQLLVRQLIRKELGLPQK